MSERDLQIMRNIEADIGKLSLTEWGVFKERVDQFKVLIATGGRAGLLALDKVYAEIQAEQPEQKIVSKRIKRRR